MAFGRTFLYHSTAPKGIIFDKEDEYLTALKDGWVEAPWLVGEPPQPRKEPVKMASVGEILKWDGLPTFEDRSKVPPKIKKPPSTKPIKVKKSPGRKAGGRKAGGNK